MRLHYVRLFLCAGAALGASEQGGCGPDCVGQCFAGTCLFSAAGLDDLDNEDAFISSNLYAVSPHATRIQPVASAPQQVEPAPAEAAMPQGAELREKVPQMPSSERSSMAPAEPAMPQGADLWGEVPQMPASQLPSSERSSMAMVATDSAPMPQAIPVLPSSEVAPALSFSKPAGAGAAAPPVHPAKSVQQPTARRSFLYSAVDQVLSQTAVKVLTMKDELSHAKVDEDRLDAENTALKSELEKWRAVGEHVANREAKAVELLQRGGSEPEAPQAPATTDQAPTGVSLLAQATGSLQHLRTMAAQKAPSNRGTWVAIASIATCVMLWALGSALEVSGKVSKARSAWRGASLPWPTAPQCMAPMLRSVGAAHYRIEISEIHVGSLLGGGDVQVSVRVGEHASEACTEVVRKGAHGDGSFLRFSETFTVDVRKGGAPVVLQVIDGRGKLASLRLPAREAIGLALREGSAGYFRSELAPEPALMQVASACRRPYAAMKIRDVTSAAAGGVLAAKPGFEGALVL